MAEIRGNVVVCSCEDTMRLDDNTVRKGCGSANLSTARHLCRAELERFRAMVDNPGHRLPPHWWDGAADPALPALALVPPGARAKGPLRHVLSQSFAFGGSNAALVFGGE